MHLQPTETDIHCQWNINSGQRLAKPRHSIADCQGRLFHRRLCIDRLDRLWRLLRAGSVGLIHKNLEGGLFVSLLLITAFAEVFIFRRQRLGIERRKHMINICTMKSVVMRTQFK